jgi:hypothetical protein
MHPVTPEHCQSILAVVTASPSPNRKKVLSIVVALCTVAAGVVGFLANTTSVIDFFSDSDFDHVVEPGSATSEPKTPTERSEDEQLPSKSSAQSSAPKRTLVVPPISDTGITPSPYEPGEPRTAVEQEFHGNWVGLIYQVGIAQSPYSVEIKIIGGDVVHKSAKFDMRVSTVVARGACRQPGRTRSGQLR